MTTQLERVKQQRQAGPKATMAVIQSLLTNHQQLIQVMQQNASKG
ncbi:hypothetical protein [Pseudoalteromonas viridis]|nr:hypothetical protein [Pseudoalteromonas viridis]